MIPVLIVAIVMIAVVLKSRYRHLDRQGRSRPRSALKTFASVTK